MSDDSSEDLLYLIGLRDEDSGGAEDAWSDFYNRHAGFLYTVLKNQYGEEFGEHTIEDMTAETMRRAHLHAATYSPERAQGSNPERRVRTWLFGIARNLLRDAYSKGAFQPVPMDPQEFWEAIAPGPDPLHFGSEVLALVRQEFEALPERDRDVLLLYAFYYPKRIQRGDMQQLAKRYSTDAQNMEKVKQRALRKLKARLLRGGIKPMLEGVR
ncbi:MAG TPA: hypothetical protein DEA08_18695 [Planctomycetes bacterium]|nr:hypothetical protein [Planctomycetota bacterium]